MRWIGAICFALMLSAAAPAFAGTQILYGPAGGWVQRLPLTSASASPGGALQLQLKDEEVRYRPDGEDVYTETVIKILSTQGLQQAGNLGTVWDPSHSDLTINTAQIVRDGQVIDLAADHDFSALQRETGLSVSMLDGNLTAIKQIRDLRVGDVIVFAATVDVKRPLPGALAEGGTALARGSAADRFRFRAVWLKSMPMRWKATEGIEGVKVEDHGATEELIYDASNAKAPTPASGAPDRYDNLAQLEMTSYKSWSDISRLFAPLYVTASTLAPSSPLKAEAARIRQANPTDEGRALAALRLVQDQIRYLALVFGEGGYTPASADLTWTQRYGDCKAKSALLMALLKELGIKAEAAAVTTEAGNGAPDRLPRLGVFNHVIVRAEIKGKIYWLDGTRQGDTDLASLADSPFGYALPFRSAGSEFEKLPLHAATRPLSEATITLDASGGLDTDGPGSYQVVLRGDEGLALSQVLGAVSKTDGEKYVRDAWGSRLNWLKVDKIEFGYSEELSGYRVYLEGKGKFEWTANPSTGIRQESLDSSFDTPFPDRKDEPHLDIPFALNFPYFDLMVSRVKLPQGGAGFRLNGADVDQVAAGMEIKRSSKLENGEVVVSFSTRTLQPEVSATDVAAAKLIIAALPTKDDVYIDAPRTMVAPVGPQGGVADYIRRGQLLASQGKFAEAAEAYDAAIAKDPTSAEARFDRIQMYSATGDSAGAIAAATKMTEDMPREILAFTNLALLQRDAGHLDEALADTRAAVAIDEKSYAAQNALALVYLSMRRPDEMLIAEDRVIDTLGAADGRLALGSLAADIVKIPAAERPNLIQALAAHEQSPAAWALRGKLAGDRDTATGIADYDAALRLRPDFVFALVEQAGDYISLGDDAHALADLDRAVRLQRNPNWFAVRAAVYVRLGRLQDAILDYRDAIALSPGDVRLFTGRCATRLQIGDLQLALDDCNKALDLLPRDATGLSLRGTVRLKSGAFDAAAEDFSSSIAVFDSAEARYGLGIAKSRLGDKAAADAELAKARQYDSAIAARFELYGLTP